MNELISLVFEDKNVRALQHEGQTVFVAKDVCDVLGLNDVSLAVNGRWRIDENSGEKYRSGGLDEDEKLILTLAVSGQSRDFLVINEYGLYNLILKSRKPEAKKFKRWVTHDVIPSLRETGSYQLAPQTESEKRLQMLQIMSEQEKNLAALDDRVSKVEDSVRIDAGQQNILNKAISKRVYKVFETIDDEDITTRKLFPKIYRNLKDAFHVSSYRDIRKLDFKEALEWVSTWRPM